MRIPKSIRSQLEKIVRKWKKEYWINTWYALSEQSRFDAVKILIEEIYPIFPHTAKRKLNFTGGKGKRAYMAVPGDDADWIIINKDNVSIISTLHELGHIIYGVGEKEAQSFAESFFRTFFPKEYLSFKRQGLTPPTCKHASTESSNHKTNSSTIQTPTSIKSSP